MAEVRKKINEDKYNTKSIKIDSSKKEKKGKQVNKAKTKDNGKKESKGLWTKFMIFCHGVKSEFDKVHWTKKDDMIKYSIATVAVIIFCSIFFYLIDLIFAFIQSLAG